MSSKNSGLIAYYCNFRFCRENAVHFVVLAIFYVALCSLVNTWCSLPAAAEEISILLLLLVFELLRYRRKPKEQAKILQIHAKVSIHCSYSSPNIHRQHVH